MARFSVITPCFNHGKYIHEMLTSVLNQTYRDFEVIIVNDGSTDDTKLILDGIIHDKVKIIHTSNYGPAHARNLAINESSGSYILNLDADDKIAPAYLEKCVEIFDNHNNIGIIYSEVQLIGANDGPYLIPEYSFENMLKANCIGSTSAFRKSDFLKTTGYSSEMIYGYEDFEFWLSILELGRDVYKIPETMVFYRTYHNHEDCRSGRRKLDDWKMQFVVIQAFQRHKSLYSKAPEVFKIFSDLESSFMNN